MIPWKWRSVVLSHVFFWNEDKEKCNISLAAVLYEIAVGGERTEVWKIREKFFGGT